MVLRTGSLVPPLVLKRLGKENIPLSGIEVFGYSGYAGEFATSAVEASVYGEYPASNEFSAGPSGVEACSVLIRFAAEIPSSMMLELRYGP